MHYYVGFLTGGAYSMSAVWLAVTVLMLVIEGAVPGLVSIWFALGAFAALLAAILRAPIWLQVTWFLLVSVTSLVLTRPLAKKYVNSRVQPTNADMLIGRQCVVKEEINNLAGTGAVMAGGREWTARADCADKVIAAGEAVEIVRIEGVKLIVK